MSGTDVAGLAGVFLMLIAYAGASTGRLDPERPAALLANLAGAGLVLFSLLRGDFNLSATVMESIWGAVALVGLVRWAVLNMMQAHCHIFGGRRSPAFAACGRNTSVIEYDLLMSLKGLHQ